MYAFSTHRISSSAAPKPALIAGIATFTIVVSSRIMKKPVVSTSNTSQGLERALAMVPPQRFMAGVHSHFPLQLAFGDLAFELDDPFAFRVEHCDLVLDLDQGETGNAFGDQFPVHQFELGDDPGE